MSEVVVPLLDLPALVKAPSGQLPSKADFLCLLWGSVGGEGDQGRGGEGNKEGGAEGNQGGAGEGNKEEKSLTTIMIQISSPHPGKGLTVVTEKKGVVEEEMMKVVFVT